MRAQSVFQAAHDLPLVFQRLCVLDAKFESEEGNRHSFEFQVSSFEPNSNVSSAEAPSKPETRNLFLRHHFGCDALGHKSFNHVADLDVTVVRDRDTALHSVRDLAGVIFEAAQRPDFAFEHHHIVA